MICPCKECPNRKIGCHGTCVSYAEWRNWRDQENVKERAARVSNYADEIWVNQHYKKIKKRFC